MKELALEKTKLDGRYEITELLGRGSYAEIYLARDRQAATDSLHGSVVIKALNVFLQEEPDVELERTLIENFQNEAVALDRVRHPNVINRLGHGTARDLRGTIFHYLVLEYLPGGDLMQLCKRAPLSLEKTLLYLEQVCAGLGHAHARGVIHRDVKPQNLLLTRDRQIVKIADFGVARFANLDSPITRVGTNVYAAPEHSPLNAALESANGGGKTRLTPAADVYSLAKTVYALLAGESPRKFSNAPVTSFPPPLAEKIWARGVLTVLEHATQSSLDARIKTVDDFWKEIYAAVNEVEEATRVLSPELLTKINDAGNFTPQAPASPSFNSLPNVQIPVRAEPELPERPRLVVELGKTQTAQAAAPFPARTASAASRPAQSETMLNGRITTVNGNAPVSKIAASNAPLSQMVEQQAAIYRQPSRATAFLQRMAIRFAVVLLLLGTFAGVLAGTFNYLQTRGYLPTAIFKAEPLLGREAIINQTVNLRADAGVANEDIGDVPNASRVKILKVKENWYEVEIIKRSAPKINSADADRGWINGKYVDVQ